MSSVNMSHMGGLKTTTTTTEKTRSSSSSLGPLFLRKPEQESNSISSRPTKPHRRSDSRGSRASTILTATSSLSGTEELSDKQTYYSHGERSGNLSDSILSEENNNNNVISTSSHHRQLGEKRRRRDEKQHTTSYSADPEQPKPADGEESAIIEGAAADTESGILEQVFGGMSSLISNATEAVGSSLPLAALEASSSYRSQPPPPMPEGGRKIHEEEKKEDGIHKSSTMKKKKNADIGNNNNNNEEEEAMLRFDRLKDLVMMGDLVGADEDIIPPNPEPLKEEKFYPVQKNQGSGYFSCSCDGYYYDPITKRMTICTVLALALLVALVIPIFLLHNGNQKSAAGAALGVATVPPTTPSPTTTMSPSISPSVSKMPSNRPTERPSPSPTVSSMPTFSPSLRPTASKEPSQIPSISQIPSLAPSKAPSISKEPSHHPSTIPSFEPSTSFMPSYSTISPDYSFKVRLQWQQSYFWQEEKVERWWCLECVQCQSYGGGDGNEHGCRSYGTGYEGVCQAGDSIWIRDCRERANRFNVLQNRESGNMLRIATTNLCVTRERRRWLKVEECDRNRLDQQFVPWDNYDKFELRPLAYKDWGEREADCVSQLHHPKQDELVSLHNCRLCRIYETRYWQVYLG